MSRLEKLQYWLQSHQFEMSLLLVQNRETTVLLLWWVFCVRKRGGVDFVFVQFPLKTNKYSETRNRPGIGRPVVKSQFPSFQSVFFRIMGSHVTSGLEIQPRTLRNTDPNSSFLKSPIADSNGNPKTTSLVKPATIGPASGVTYYQVKNSLGYVFLGYGFLLVGFQS